jgi:hypothetical protein
MVNTKETGQNVSKASSTPSHSAGPIRLQLRTKLHPDWPKPSGQSEGLLVKEVKLTMMTSQPIDQSDGLTGKTVLTVQHTN